MQSAFVSMQDCQISDCDGPALDVSDEARAELRGCVIGGNTGRHFHARQAVIAGTTLRKSFS